MIYSAYSVDYELCSMFLLYSMFIFQHLNLIFFPAVMEAIPTIVCDTLYAMGLHDQTPSWKIMDNKGRITVVLHWEREEADFQAIVGPSRQSSTTTIASGGPRLLGVQSRSLSQV